MSNPKNMQKFNDLDFAGLSTSDWMHPSSANNNSGVFEVLVDERKNSEANADELKNIASNFFYDEKLWSLLGGASVHGDHQQQTSDNELSSDDDLEPFKKMARNMEDITGSGDVLKKLISPGIGPNLTLGTVIECHYSCYLEYSDEPIDSTHFRNKAFKSKIGEGNTIPGLVTALSSMKLKECSYFLISPHYAFGKLGSPPRIPPNAWLLYKVSLISAVDCADADNHIKHGWDWEKFHGASFEERMQTALSYHRKGNSLMESGSLPKAASCYQRAIWLMEESPLKTEEQRSASFLLQAKLHANIAKVWLERKQPRKVADHCRLALELPFSIPADLKAKIYFRYAKAKFCLDSFADARKFLLLAQNLKPNCPDVAKELIKIAATEKQNQKREKVLCQKMCSAMSLEPENKEKNDSGARKRAVTVQGGVTITEVDDDDGVRGPIKQKSEEEEVKAKLKPKFIDLVMSEMNRLANSQKMKQIVFPSNLSLPEISFIDSAASTYNFKMEFTHKGNVRYPKVVKAING